MFSVCPSDFIVLFAAIYSLNDVWNSVLKQLYLIVRVWLEVILLRVCFRSNDLFSEMKFLMINCLAAPVTLSPPPFPGGVMTKLLPELVLISPPSIGWVPLNNWPCISPLVLLPPPEYDASPHLPSQSLSLSPPPDLTALPSCDYLGAEIGTQPPVTIKWQSLLLTPRAACTRHSRPDAAGSSCLHLNIATTNLDPPLLDKIVMKWRIQKSVEKIR